MVWHIFKKDWKLAWVFVLVVAVVHWIDSAITYKIGLFDEDPMLAMLADAVPMLAFFASMFLIGAIVHLDSIPGVREDWLVRPISRWDLALEKFLFVVVMVNGPIFAAVLLQGFANRFSFRLSFAAASWQFTFFLFAFTLPIFSFASVTRNLTQAFIFGCSCSFIILGFQTMAGYVNGRAHGTLESISWSGIGWVGETARFALSVAAAVIILRLQYFHRKTLLSRCLVLLFGVALLATQFIPWNVAFAIEQRLSPKPGAGMSTVFAFNPQLDKFRSPSGLSASSDQGRRYNQGEHMWVYLPLQVTRTQPDAFLLTDLVEVRLIGQGGKVAFHGRGESLEFKDDGTKNNSLYQGIQVPASVYREIKDGAVRAEVNYSLTLFGLKESYSIPALDGNERMPGFGWCETKLNEVETAVELRCMQPGKGPSCATLLLENETTGQRNPARSSCQGDYSPYSGWYFGDNMAHFGANVPFRDPSGLAKFPVDGPQLPNSRIVIRVYEPEDHFTRSLVIPEVKLKDWEAQ